MSEEEADMFDIARQDRFDYVRLDRSKVNLIKRSGAIKWFRLVSVAIGNTTEMYPDGDEIQTVEPWKPPPLFGDMEVETINAILDQIDHGLGKGAFYSASPAARGRAAWTVVKEFCPYKTDKQCREVIMVWLKSGLLVLVDFYDEKDRKERKGLRVDRTKRPGTLISEDRSLKPYGPPSWPLNLSIGAPMAQSRCAIDRNCPPFGRERQWRIRLRP